MGGTGGTLRPKGRGIDRVSFGQPLTLRYDYGSKRVPPSIAQSGLPGGGPSDKGLPLDSGIPGTNTFAKPPEDARDFDNSQSPKDENIYRVDQADDLLKDRDRIDTKEDWGQDHDNIGVPGKGTPDHSPKTKYPYRDDRKHKHYAAVLFVAEVDQLRTAHEWVVPVRIATRVDTIEDGLNPKVVQRSKACSVTLKRADIPNLRWLFSVDCGNGPKVVRLKGSRDARVKNMPRMDLRMSCSCPAWRWLGPEHWAKGEIYLDGSPRGTASEPVIRDPQGINRVCKHVAAVLNSVRQWQIPQKSK